MPDKKAQPKRHPDEGNDRRGADSGLFKYLNVSTLEMVLGDLGAQEADLDAPTRKLLAEGRAARERIG